MNGTDLGQRSGSCSASSGADGQVPSSSSSPALDHVSTVINGDATPNSTPVHQPPDSDPDIRMGDFTFFLYTTETKVDVFTPFYRVISLNKPFIYLMDVCAA